MIKSAFERVQSQVSDQTGLFALLNVAKDPEVERKIKTE